MGRTAKPIKTERADAQGDRRFITALARGIDVLRCFGPGEQWLANQEIARRTGLPKPTVSRLTFTLTSLGYLDRSPEREMYCLGLPVLGLGFRVLSQFDLGRIARPFMQALADKARGAVSLGVRHGDSAIYVAHCRSPSPLTLGLDVGARLPLTDSAMGRAILFSLPEWASAQALAHAQEASPDRWDALQAGLALAERDLARLGFVASPPDANIAVVAVPLHVGDGREPLGLNCGGPASIISRERLLSEIGPNLLETAAAIERAIRSEN